MEYWWENVPPDTGPNIVPSTEGEMASDPLCSSVGETLQKLISIAKLNFTKAKVSKWLCTHNEVASCCII